MRRPLVWRRLQLAPIVAVGREVIADGRDRVVLSASPESHHEVFSRSALGVVPRRSIIAKWRPPTSAPSPPSRSELCNWLVEAFDRDNFRRWSLHRESIIHSPHPALWTATVVLLLAHSRTIASASTPPSSGRPPAAGANAANAAAAAAGAVRAHDTTAVVASMPTAGAASTDGSTVRTGLAASEEGATVEACASGEASSPLGLISLSSSSPAAARLRTASLEPGVPVSREPTSSMSCKQPLPPDGLVSAEPAPSVQATFAAPTARNSCKPK
mmetsp:Transcript_129303/g.335290  ORF Transcript_129303/g.335290 Transcript_129303/m.335290 type:complete len:272 (+) Transcript_129303:389-1204(+)